MRDAMLVFGSPMIDEAEIAEVVATLRSGWIGTGPRVAHFEALFREYVGVTPKWVIQRYRLFEAAERLASGQADGAQLAHELGYFDQAHFIRDFKAMVGKSPLAFARDLNST